MITLKHKNIEKLFEINNSSSYTIIIENTRFLYSFISDLMNNDEERIFLAKDYKAIDFSKKVLLITNVLDLEINSRKLLSVYYQRIEEAFVNNEKRQAIQEICGKIVCLLEDVRLFSSVSCDYNDNLSLKDFLSMVNYSIVDNTKSLLERIILKVKLMKEISDFYVLIIPFLDSFLTDEELILLRKELSYLDVCIICVSSYDKKLTWSEKIIIDNDLCEI